MYYDPFANVDPDTIKPFTPSITAAEVTVTDEERNAKNGEVTTFDPGATEFCPSSNVQEGNQDAHQEDPPLWQVVAAEESGKAVAVAVLAGDVLLTCTSPAFECPCSHPGLSCYDWNTVSKPIDAGATRESSPSSESPQPQQHNNNLTDSGFETSLEIMTDNSSELSYDGLHHQVADYAVDQDQFYSYTQIYPGSVDLGYTSSLVEDQVASDSYSVPPLLVSPDHQQYEAWSATDPSSWSAGLALNLSSLENSLASDHSTSFTEVRPAMGPFSPNTGQTQFISLGGLNADVAALSLIRKKEKVEEDRLQASEEQRKRDEFKKKVLYNLSGSSEEMEEMKIRDSFKDQVLSNLRKDQQIMESEQEKIKRAFKDKILSNLGEDSA